MKVEAFNRAKKWLPVLTAVCSIAAIGASESPAETNLPQWSERELALIQSLSLSQLGPKPPSPSNKYADNPEAAALGREIFHDSRFSANGEISCATCHRQDYGFTDNLPKAKGIGVAERRSMPIVGMAYQKWFFWDGRADSLWSQTLGPFENPAEHGIDRQRVNQLVNLHYSEAYKEVFDEAPQDHPTNRVFANTGKAIAAHVRTIIPEPTLFDQYANAFQAGFDDNTILTPAQLRGLRLFVGEGKCVNCHNGPLFTNGEFHHSGTPELGAQDGGRGAAFLSLESAEFGFFSEYSDANTDLDGDHIRFLDRDIHKFTGTFKTPSLRGVAERAPYMHNGAFTTLTAVLQNYRSMSGTQLADEIFHGDLSDQDLLDLESFLEALSPIPISVHN